MAEIPNTYGMKICVIFWRLKNQHLIANGSHIYKSKTGYVEHPRLHLWTDSWLNKSMANAL